MDSFLIIDGLNLSGSLWIPQTPVLPEPTPLVLIAVHFCAAPDTRTTRNAFPHHAALVAISAWHLPACSWSASGNASVAAENPVPSWLGFGSQGSADSRPRARGQGCSGIATTDRIRLQLSDLTSPLSC